MTDLTPAQLTAIASALFPYVPIGGGQCWNKRYATYDEYAFKLVDELVREGWETTIKRFYGSDVWWCILARPYEQHYEANDKSRQVAICLTYLRAKGVNVEKLLEKTDGE